MMLLASAHAPLGKHAPAVPQSPSSTQAAQELTSQRGVMPVQRSCVLPKHCAHVFVSVSQAGKLGSVQSLFCLHAMPPSGHCALPPEQEVGLCDPQAAVATSATTMMVKRTMEHPPDSGNDCAMREATLEVSRVIRRNRRHPASRLEPR